jgi:hypothetical protein
VSEEEDRTEHGGGETDGERRFIREAQAHHQDRIEGSGEDHRGAVVQIDRPEIKTRLPLVGEAAVRAGIVHAKPAAEERTDPAPRAAELHGVGKNAEPGGEFGHDARFPTEYTGDSAKFPLALRP